MEEKEYYEKMMLCKEMAEFLEKKQKDPYKLIDAICYYLGNLLSTGEMFEDKPLFDDCVKKLRAEYEEGLNCEFTQDLTKKLKKDADDQFAQEIRNILGIKK